MDRYPTLNETARHLIRMAEDPLTSGSKGHAALRLQELMASDPVYECLPQVIQQERARMQQEQRA